MRKKTKLVIAALVIAILIPVIAYMFWPYFHLFKSDNVTIDNEEYFYYASIICHSESEFKKLPLGTTYAEIKDRFGYPNGNYSPCGAIGRYFYIVGPNKYITIRLWASDSIIEPYKDLPIEVFRQKIPEIIDQMGVIKISCLTDEGVLWTITE